MISNIIMIQMSICILDWVPGWTIIPNYYQLYLSLADVWSRFFVLSTELLRLRVDHLASRRPTVPYFDHFYFKIIVLFNTISKHILLRDVTNSQICITTLLKVTARLYFLVCVLVPASTEHPTRTVSILVAEMEAWLLQLRNLGKMKILNCGFLCFGFERNIGRGNFLGEKKLLALVWCLVFDRIIMNRINYRGWNRTDM